MVKNKGRSKEYNLLKEKKKMYRNHFIVYLLTFIPCVLALIGFNVFLLFSASNLFLAFLVEALGDYVLFINFFLIIFDSLIGLFLTHALRGYISTKKNINQSEHSVLALERVILKFLRDNKGKAFTSASLINRINHEGLPEDVESVLCDLVGGNTINRTVKDNTPYYSI